MKTLRSLWRVWTAARRLGKAMNAEEARVRNLYGASYDALHAELLAFFVARDPIGFGPRYGRDQEKFPGLYSWRVVKTLGLIARARSAGQVRHLLYSDLRRNTDGHGNGQYVGREDDYREIAERVWAQMPPGLSARPTRTGKRRRGRDAPEQPHRASRGER